MGKINSDLVDEYADDFSSTRKDNTFYNLYKEVEDLIKVSGQRAHQRAKTYGVYIPLEDFESHFNEALWKSAIQYDKKLGKFLPRLQTYFYRLERNVLRQYETKGGDGDKNKKSYEKARNDSLDRVLDPENSFT